MVENKNLSNKNYIKPLYVVPSHILGKKCRNKYGCCYTTINKFIDMVANSFYNLVIETPDLNLYNLDLSKTNKQKTIDTIKNLITEKHISYPTKKKSYCKTDFNYDNIDD